jgi:hypothetical protein
MAAKNCLSWNLIAEILKNSAPIKMNHLSRKTITTASVASLLTTAAVLVTASPLLTTRGLGAAYAQEEEFTVDVAIDSASIDPRTKEVTVDFTVTCSQPAVGDSFVEVRQSVGRFGDKSVEGFEFIAYECSGETPLSVTIEAETGFFTGGKAFVSADAFACTEDVCDFAFTEEQVRLSPSP